MSDYKLQMYTPDLLERVCELQNHLWGRSTKLNAAYLDWKHLHNPYLEVPLVYVAICNDRVVGMRSMFGTCWEAGDYKERLVLPSAADTVIAPEHRNRGLFEELTHYAMEDLDARGYSHVLNFSPSASNYVVSVMTMGWHSIGKMEIMTRQKLTDSVVACALNSASKYWIARKAVGAGRMAGRLMKNAMHIDAFYALDRNARSHSHHPVSLAKKPRPQAMADLIRDLGGDGRLRQVRDEIFFAWRFENPRAHYRFLFWGGEDPDGYMILQNTVGQTTLNIVDWEGRNPKIRSDLLEAAISWGQYRSLCIWGATLPGSARETLKNASFSCATKTDKPDNRRGCCMLKPLGSDAACKDILGCRPLEYNSWDLRMIYSDGE